MYYELTGLKGSVVVVVDLSVVKFVLLLGSSQFC
uniref:Uncharacterized protein n=1 Tax=Arundo donax TaxID=35708 RepID=A0A0A8Z8A1_ARUDO